MILIFTILNFLLMLIPFFDWFNGGKTTNGSNREWLGCSIWATIGPAIGLAAFSALLGAAFNLDSVLVVTSGIAIILLVMRAFAQSAAGMYFFLSLNLLGFFIFLPALCFVVLMVGTDVYPPQEWHTFVQLNTVLLAGTFLFSQWAISSSMKSRNRRRFNR